MVPGLLVSASGAGTWPILGRIAGGLSGACGSVARSGQPGFVPLCRRGKLPLLLLTGTVPWASPDRAWLAALGLLGSARSNGTRFSLIAFAVRLPEFCARWLHERRRAWLGLGCPESLLLLSGSASARQHSEHIGVRESGVSTSAGLGKCPCRIASASHGELWGGRLGSHLAPSQEDTC